MAPKSSALLVATSLTLTPTGVDLTYKRLTRRGPVSAGPFQLTPVISGSSDAAKPLVRQHELAVLDFDDDHGINAQSVVVFRRQIVNA